jgi:hypothetical protein
MKSDHRIMLNPEKYHIDEQQYLSKFHPKPTFVEPDLPFKHNEYLNQSVTSEINESIFGIK